MKKVVLFIVLALGVNTSIAQKSYMITEIKEVVVANKSDWEGDPDIYKIDITQVMVVIYENKILLIFMLPNYNEAFSYKIEGSVIRGGNLVYQVESESDGLGLVQLNKEDKEITFIANLEGSPGFLLRRVMTYN